MGIGIDFGTTNSAAIFSRTDGTLIPGVRDKGGDGQRPKPDSSKVWVRNDGAAVYSLLPPNPATFSLIRKLKWYLGNQPEIALDGRSHNAMNLSTGYLRWIRDELAGSVGGEIGAPNIAAVASVPNKSWPGYRRMLRGCLQEAGFRSVRLVYEPTAAAVACLHEAGAFHNPAKYAGPVLVIDWGGGTVDVSLLELKSNRTLVDINTASMESGLGGGDMDEWLAMAAAREKPGMEMAWANLSLGDRNALLDRIERFKIRAFDEFDMGRSLNPEEILVSGTGGQTITLTHELVRDCVNYFSQKVQEIALKATMAAGLASDDVRYKILVGGPFQSDFVRNNTSFRAWPHARTLSHQFGAQLATAAGCALLARSNFDLLLGCDIGVMEADGGFFKVANRNERLPSDEFETKIVLAGQQFDMTDLTCSHAIFEFARTSGRNGQDKIVPIGMAQVPVSHTIAFGVMPFSPMLEKATLDCDLNFNVTLRGILGGVENLGPVADDLIKTSKQYDCLPLKLHLPKWFGA